LILSPRFDERQLRVLMVIKNPDALWVTFERYLTGDSVAADEWNALPGYAFICGICGCPFLTSMLDAGMSERSADPADPQDWTFDVRRSPNPHRDPRRAHRGTYLALAQAGQYVCRLAGRPEAADDKPTTDLPTGR
jgi:hypothetical protein